MDQRIYPHPDYPDQTERVILVDLDDRTPLFDIQAEVLNRALSQMTKDRAKLNESIRKISQRLVLSGEEKVRRSRSGH